MPSIPFIATDKSYYSNLANKYRFTHSRHPTNMERKNCIYERKTVSIQSLTPSSLKMFISQLLSRSFPSPTGNRHTISSWTISCFYFVFIYYTERQHLRIRQLERHVEYFAPFFLCALRHFLIIFCNGFLFYLSGRRTTNLKTFIPNVGQEIE